MAKAGWHCSSGAGTVQMDQLVLVDTVLVGHRSDTVDVGRAVRAHSSWWGGIGVGWSRRLGGLMWCEDYGRKPVREGMCQ